MEVYIIQRPNILKEEVDKFLASENMQWNRTKESTKAEDIIEISGRVCYMSFGERQSPRSNFEYIRNLIESGHHSVIEHISWTFIVTGVTRAFTHQLVRHRVGFSFSQLSQQYYNNTSPEILTVADSKEEPFSQQAKQLEKETLKLYQKALIFFKENCPSGLSNKEANRWVNTQARAYLPNNCETKICVTANARALRHFFDVRGGIEGDYEMRLFSSILLEKIRKDAPSVFYDFNVTKDENGWPLVILK